MQAAIIDAVKIAKALQRAFQCINTVVAGFGRCVMHKGKHRGRYTWLEKAVLPVDHSTACVQMPEPLFGGVVHVEYALLQERMQGHIWHIRLADGFPEFSQSLHPPSRGIACNDRGVKGTDRDAG